MTVHRASLLDTARSLRCGRRSVTSAVEDSVDRLDDFDPALRAFVPEPKRHDRLSDAAMELDDLDSTARGPLYGVPVGVKDVFRVDGLPTKAGSELPPTTLSGPEAAVVRRLREADALVLGKTRTAEFACFDPPETRNPHDHDHTPGGSSSGSAAAVAAGICPLALGTQTVGSTLRPAAFCGIVGFKPTFGRLPTAGTIPVSKSLDHVGLFTQRVASMRLAAAICCPDWLPESNASLIRPTLGVPEGLYLKRASPAGREAFEEGLERLAAAGYGIERVPLFEDFETIDDRHTTLMAAELALVHEERGWYPAHANRYAEATTDLIETGRKVVVHTIATARAGRSALRETITRAMDTKEIDLWVSPAAPGPAPEGIDDTGDPLMNLPWTYAGLPAVSVPAGRSGGLPVGLQCVARSMDDERLLAWAAGIETALSVE
jgi:Asp-tRNA(Asn)/Glu-tRNA(Gln) amidotransferase A subunit family amidase